VNGHELISEKCGNAAKSCDGTSTHLIVSAVVVDGVVVTRRRRVRRRGDAVRRRRDSVRRRGEVVEREVDVLSVVVRADQRTAERVVVGRVESRRTEDE